MTVLRDDNAFRSASGYPDPLSGEGVTTQEARSALKESRRHWSRVAGTASTPEAIAMATATLGRQLREGLSPWIGALGYAALERRALQEARATHPAVSAISLSTDDGKATAVAVREHGAAAVSEGVIAVVAKVIELLGRIVGADMALRLAEQWENRARAES